MIHNEPGFLFEQVFVIMLIMIKRHPHLLSVPHQSWSTSFYQWAKQLYMQCQFL